MINPKYHIVVLVIIGCSYICFPQHRFNLNVSQAYSDDWQTGKMHSIEMGSSADFRFKINIDTINLAFNFRYAAGAAYDKPADSIKAYLRPTDNDLFIESVVKYPLGWKVDPFFSFSAQTQIMESYRFVRGNTVRTANFRDPITTIQSLGFAYGISQGKEFLNSRIGISLKQIRAERYIIMTDDPKTPLLKESYKIETGINWKTEVSAMIDSVANYMGTLDLFSTFDHPDTWTLKFQNEFQFFIWRFFGITTKFDFVYDEKQKIGLQLKQSIRFGVGVIM